jgi:nucleotide-binding universal stress UspA family protein
MVTGEEIMTWKPIIAGVDMSPEGARAAVVASRLAETAGTRCFLAHAVHDTWAEASLAPVPVALAAINQIVLETAEAEVRRALHDKVPADVLDTLEVRFGPTGLALNDVIDARDAELLVLGGKHHSHIGRWLGGSTAHHMVRTAEVPILVTGPADAGFRRVLAAVDLSSAARPTLAAAERMADLFDAKLRVLHVVEPMPIAPGLPGTLTDQELMALSENELEESVWPLIGRADAEHLVRRGHPAETIAQAAAEWAADLIVVGTHGRGWVDRVLIGSVTERLLNRLPTAMLVVPVSAPTSRRPARRAAATPSRRPVRARR